MQDALKELWALQKIDSEIHELERKLAGLDTGAELAKKRDRAKARFDSVTSRLHSIDAELKDVDLQLKSTETKRKDFETRMYSGKVTAAKELEAMQQEIEMLARNRDKLETRELELMDEQTAVREDLTGATAEFESLEKQLASLVSSGRQEFGSLTRKLEEVRKLRDPQAAGVQGKSMAVARKYEFIRSKSIYPAVAILVGSKCGSCQVTLPGNMVREIRQGLELVTCESCGRILLQAEGQ